MQVIFFVIFTFVGGAFAAPREKSYDYRQYYSGFPFGFGSVATAGSAGAAAGSWPYPGYPAYYSPFFNPFFPWPVIKPPIPWYEGPNVCTDKKVVPEPEDIQSWFSEDGTSSSWGAFDHQSSTCRGNNTKYACSERVVNEKGSQIVLTKFECCKGFIRDPEGPGCVKKSSADDVTAADAPTSVKTDYPGTEGDRFSYVFSSSNSDTRSGSDVEKVAAQ